MSDTYYREKAQRRNRLLILGAVLVIIILCIYFGTVALFRDSCTMSFNRAPEDIVRSYIDYISNGDLDGVINCWEHQTFYELGVGCSDICISKVIGSKLNIIDIKIDEPVTTNAGRHNITAHVSVTCANDDTEYQGEILLDGISSDLPWRHWKIVESTIGGTLVNQWCSQ